MTLSRALGDYTLIKQVGQGSLGSVFLAEHRFMKKQYLLKVLPPELSEDRAFITRLEEDVAALAQLDHPHIAKIHNVSYANGRYFLVIDCIVDELGETTNLAQYLLSLNAPLREEEILGLLSQVADALDYAHSKNLIHRGVKLSNILVGRGASKALDLYLTDYGLSRIVGTGAVLSRLYKNVAEALNVGTGLFPPKTEPERYPSPQIENQKLVPLHATFLQNFSFLAPEQRRLEAGSKVTTKVDVYAFGVLTYYLLMGEFPEGIFEMPKGKQLNWEALLRQCLQSNPAKRPEFLMEILQLVKTKEAEHIPETQDKKYSSETGTTTNTTAQTLMENTSVIQQPAVAVVNPTKADTVQPIIKASQIERPQHVADPSQVFQIDNTVKTYTPEEKELKEVEPLRTDMVIISGASYMRGSNDGSRDEMPRHKVNLDTYAIDIHPVTNEQFVRFLEMMGGEKDSNHLDIIQLRDSRIKRRSGKLMIESGYAKHPVVGVTWYGATAYAKWVGKRLPTEAEWEIAAQGGLENAPFPTGDDLEKSQANFFSADTTAVMSYPASELGLYDMAGNVYEWCQDWYGYNYYEVSIQEPDNPQGPLQGVYRVLRGGCWKSLKEDLRCSRRHRNNPGTVNGTYGFRCAADVQAVN
jgi:formylglycine-generating enzyme required for sulfatase activity